MNKKTVRDIEVQGKRVLVRVDFNVPMQDGQITDDRRIRASLPTIQYLLEQGATVVLMSHFGRPKGKRDPQYSLRPVAERLSQLLGREVLFLDDCVGEQVEAQVRNAPQGSVILLENLRFHPEEEANDPAFAQALARLGEVYVNDAFGSAHRAHASTEGVAHYLPAVAGFLMEKELRYLGQALANPEHPFVAILGGAKVHDKIGVIRNLLPKVDRLLIGGGMAFTFLKAQGYEIGRSLLDAESIEFARQTLAEAGDKILLPTDVVVADALAPGVATQTVPVSAIPADKMGLDIGAETAQRFAEVVRTAKTVVWNGPLGAFETPPFEQGTRVVMEALANSGAVSILGGGDTAACAEQLGFAERMTHISTGGGASLEFLEGRTLPGVAALMDA
ncbi:phosphoglycerate kinase [Armatimonadetes bacterium GBS]|jgi:phosphoglycerate kinase|nr:MAG: phosphoglycerate kinase [Fimbriimonadales bacterium]CUU11387.1 phosphoglycerate kinase [Armatimonadetes bacterium GBS]CUU38701.1 phosphoglycerate kinase [Armatimonadetes bacterium GXS]